MHARPLRSLAPLTAALLLAGAVACGDRADTDRAADTSDVAAAMLESRTDPGLGTGPSVPVAGGSQPSQSLPPGGSAADGGAGDGTSEPGGTAAGGVATAGGAGARTDGTAGTGADGARSGRSSAAGGSSDDAIDLATLGFDSGAPEATVQVVEFSDFGCGYCARFHNEVFPTLEREYIATGKVAWKYVPMILGMFGPNAELAARAGECAGEQDRFPAMRDALFERQREWKGAGDPIPLFRTWADEQDLDVERWSQCVDEGWRDRRILAGTQVSRQAGVRGTPTFYILGYAPIPGALPLELFREVLDTVIAQRAR